MKVKFIILFSIALIPMASMAQTIEGHIMEKEMNGTEVPLIGANVYWDGTNHWHYYRWPRTILVEPTQWHFQTDNQLRGL